MHGARRPPVQHVDDGRRGNGARVLRRLLRLLPTVPGSLCRPTPATALRPRAGRTGNRTWSRSRRGVADGRSAPRRLAAAPVPDCRGRACRDDIALLPVFRLEARCRAPVLPYQPASLRALLRRNSSLRVFSVVNALWEFSFAGLKSFIVLYIVRGLGRSPAAASAVIGVVAVAYIVGAPVAGWLADRYGILRVLRIMSLVLRRRPAGRRVRAHTHAALDWASIRRTCRLYRPDAATGARVHTRASR